MHNEKVFSVRFEGDDEQAGIWPSCGLFWLDGFSSGSLVPPI